MNEAVTEADPPVLHSLEGYVHLIGEPAVERTYKDLRRRLGQRAREIARARFLMSRLAEEWVDLIGQMDAERRECT